MTDKELLMWYTRGWYDESKNKDDVYSIEGLPAKAYLLGRQYYWAGDDVSSADEMSDEELIKLIRNG